ncbi:MAG: rhomboid family intramembrane serine protease [Chloroflexi bacterium]|nr:rhomboid family intramembrane serine protease [Chloroflexota bacterium]
MFMHAGWLHILSNMLYLSVFGDNVEDRFGHLKFLVFYLICGVVATFVQIAFTRNSDVPTLGASGAIAGVLAAYVFMLPSSQSGACRKSKVKGRVLPGSTSDPDTH